MYSAENPASRPKIRNTPIRSCEPSVVRWRLIASFARVIAVENPMQYSVPWTSLSMVLGIAISATPASARTCEYDSVSSPPIVTSTSMPSSLMCCEHERRQVVTVVADGIADPVLGREPGGQVRPTRIFRGLVREVCRIVPPVRSIVRVLIRSSGRR